MQAGGKRPAEGRRLPQYCGARSAPTMVAWLLLLQGAANLGVASGAPREQMPTAPTCCR